MRQWYQQQHGGGLKIAGERYVALRKSVPSDRREALSGDVSTIRERLYWQLHVLISDLGYGPVGIAKWSPRRGRLPFIANQFNQWL